MSRKSDYRCVALCLFSSVLMTIGWTGNAHSQQQIRSLDGDWQFRREDATDDWKSVVIPASFESHEGAAFDGVGLYRKVIPRIELLPGRRAILHFQAVATVVEVWFDGQELGSHTGGWTPFRFDVTEIVRASDSEQHEIRVRVDEKVGHNSQGFLPIIAPHFGGLWQEVRLLVVPDIWIDDTRILAIGNPGTGRMRLEVPLVNAGADAGNSHQQQLRVRYRLIGNGAWSAWQSFPAETKRKTVMDFPVEGWRWWSPENPQLYELEIQLVAKPGQDFAEFEAHPVRVQAAFRSIETDGNRLRLNGKPLNVRGLLNWGYAPPGVAPSIDESDFRAELEFARSHGFNLMKFCLWIPPQRYLQMADEMGMLTWVEYPTWHSRWTLDQLPGLQREFAEFFCHDRNHPSVILRSLTCETGPDADLKVIQSLYDQCHRMIPGCLVEDDSSWIGWNRVHDFWDDHPYGNNHTWVETLSRLKTHVRQNGLKPLILGEAIAADTWACPQELLDAVDGQRPFWLPRFLDGNQQWLEKFARAAGPSGLDALQPESLQYALLMRKFQIEAFRREVPDGGYVVSVIRDFPLAAMGLIDYLGRSKWSPEQWSWHADSMLLLRTPDDRRSFQSGQSIDSDILVSHFGTRSIRNGHLQVSMNVESNANSASPDGDRWYGHEAGEIQIGCGSLERLHQIGFQVPDISQPVRVVIRAELSHSAGKIVNHWPVWIVPDPTPRSNITVWRHGSCSPSFAESVGLQTVPMPGIATDGLVLARRLDPELFDHLTSGGRVLMLPDGEAGSFPLRDEWFLRGAPCLSGHPLFQSIPREMLIELQHFDLASKVIPDVGYLDQIDPIVMLWNNHDLDHVKTQGLVFESRIGQGRLLVSALNHRTESSSVGRWLLQRFVQHLATGDEPKNAMSGQSVDRMSEAIRARQINLTRRKWQFRPDPENLGLQQDWIRAKTDPDQWQEISIGQSWESQGFDSLDGWAWYRIRIDVPPDWVNTPVYLSFAGVDDHYQLYVDGELVGGGGDPIKQQTAFDEQRSHEITTHVTPGQPLQIVVRVYDWYGAGGIHRPVMLTTAPANSGVKILE